MAQGYFRFPTVSGDRVVFVSEDDLWEVALDGGVARRLTSGQGDASAPALSPDGTQLAFSSTEEGVQAVYVMPAGGGEPRRLTFEGVACSVVGWSPDGASIRYTSSAHEPFGRRQGLWSVPAAGGEPTRLPVGEGVWWSEQASGAGRALGRHRADLARWKRYRGGLSGVIWVDEAGDDGWRPLLAGTGIEGGQCRPLWIGDRIWFTSDHEGHGNLYSCTSQGGDIQRHTDHEGFYVRFATTDGRTVVYTVGGELWALDVASGAAAPIPIEYRSPRVQLQRKFVSGQLCWEDFALHPQGHSMAVIARGRAYNFGLWEGAVRQSGEEQGVRYRLPLYLKDGKRLVVVSDEGGEERLELHWLDGSAPPQVVTLEGAELGRPIDAALSPVGDTLAIANHRQELVCVELATGAAVVVDRSDEDRLRGMSWSSDGRWLAYGVATSAHTSVIRVADRTSWEVRDVTEGTFADESPCFDPKGRYLYFVSFRHFDPVYGGMFFELSFPRGQRVCLITLTADLASPLVAEPRPLDGDEDDEDKDEKDEEKGPEGAEEGAEGVDEVSEEEASEEEEGEEDDTTVVGEDEEGGLEIDGEPAEGLFVEGEPVEDGEEPAEEDKEKKPRPVVIDFDGIQQRIIALPLGEGLYERLGATGERLFALQVPVTSSLHEEKPGDAPSGGRLIAWSLKSRKVKVFTTNIADFIIGPDGKTMALSDGMDVRVVSASTPSLLEDDEDGVGGDACSRETGWIDLDRISVEVDVRAEWRQMLREIWRLMRDQFWRADMSQVDWEEIWRRYGPLVERVSARGEFSDLVWTMQGELGTSHAYEYGGDYRQPPSYRPGTLGAEVRWDSAWVNPRTGLASGGYRIARILRGDGWDPNAGGPLTRPGLKVREGAVLVAINGKPLTERISVQQRLVNEVAREVELTLFDEGAEEPRTITVKAMGSDDELYYREWVDARRARVHAVSGGRVGYLHVPDMGPLGYAEFHRGLMAELGREALVVDVRYNGGGHVSQLLLEKLARRPIGYDIRRWGTPTTYPAEAPRGPLVALTNEYAGSDGDIFSHSFKLMGLGPLVGKRTWGGVIGIWPRHGLVDGSITTQPEFSFWFEDVGFTVENFGATPDVEVELPPQADARGEDPQLDAAIELAMKQLQERSPALPDFSPYPVMAAPRLKPR
jgi:tricorn protease